MWYAVERNSEDNDWGYGTFDIDEAIRMVKERDPESQIAVIDVSNERPDMRRYYHRF